jgi:hypothetical protein
VTRAAGINDGGYAEPTPKTSGSTPKAPEAFHQVQMNVDQSGRYDEIDVDDWRPGRRSGADGINKAVTDKHVEVAVAAARRIDQSAAF